jgi:Protein required for attachment to host cells
MKRACIAFVDATRARICEYDERNAAGHEMNEIADLVSPGRRHIGEVFEDEIGGNRTGGGGSQSTATDDHRQHFVGQRDQKFARDIVSELERIVGERQLTHVVIVAGPRLLGDLRKYDAPLRREGLQLDEVERDIAQLSNAQLHDHLAQLGLIPPRQRIAAAR